MPLAKGTKAPDFTLKRKTADGLVDVRLSDNFGKKQTVLLFFPLAFTSVCTTEMCDVSAGLSAYEDLNAEVLAVSVDSPFAQEAWAKQNNIGLKLLRTRRSSRATMWCSRISPVSAKPPRVRHSSSGPTV
jgi:peroxiredoxin